LGNLIIVLLSALKLTDKELWIDRLLVPSAVSSCICPIIIVVLVPFLKIGAYYFVFEYMLPDPHSREIGTIIWTHLLRTFLTIESCEVARTLVMTMLTIMIFTDSLLKCLTALLSKRMSFTQIRTHYKRLLIVLTMTEGAVAAGLWMGLTAWFLLTIILIWLVIKASSNLPLSIYMIVICFCFILLALLLLLLDMAGRLSDLTKNVVDYCYMNVCYYAKVESTGLERHMAKILLLQTKALVAYKASYGIVTKVDRAFVENFIYHLIDNTVTALLTF